MSVEKQTHSIFLDIFLTLITLGIWNFWVQWRQITDLNEQFSENAVANPWLVIIFSLLTLGLYFIYHEFRMTREIHKLHYGQIYPFIEIASGVATFFGLWFLVDSYQQDILNEYFSEKTPKDA